ncbi:exocyst complex component 1 isoform X1 [Galleria mellonella]|uniref:Exocyst complex component 1 isoform X1 n=1 Tax=Galleria mellonella TaxID=7137 RepID=A0ABM3MF02_GALME|nr:exocyst complex component 1 isoform X1 [Galleria mellonella]XP_052749984.1 exocyst complex component 1 isoform X1 [Galleria mellonella]
MKQEEIIVYREMESKDQTCIDVAMSDDSEIGAAPTDAALGALLEDGDAEDADAEQRVRRLGERAARLDALNVGGMLAAATEGGAGERLAARLAAGLAAGAALGGRHARLDALAQARGAAAGPARSAAARADDAARALLAELAATFAWLEPPALRSLEPPSDAALATPAGRERALATAEALRATLRAEPDQPAARRRLGAVRERLRRLARARDQLAAALARHVNNMLIHLGNEATAGGAAQRHHAELLPYAPFMRWLKDMDEKAFDALEKVLTTVETICNAEQDFCAQFFHLDVDVKADGSDGERSERSDGGERRPGADSRRLLAELFPALEHDLVALVGHVERHDPYGAMRALACVGRRVLGEAAAAGAGAGGAGAGAGAGAGGGGEARWARAALAGAAVAAKRGADRCVAERLAALPDAVKQAARRPKCGLFSFLQEFEQLSGECEAIFAAGGRRADLDRWYAALGGGMAQAIQLASHPRTPRAVLQLENFHRLQALLAALRVPALDALRRDCRARYADALRAYVTQYFGRPLEKLTQFFEGVSEAVAAGVREDEVCYRAAFSKHELRRLLAMYPEHEVRKSLHRLYRTVEKHLSEEGGLLQVVWRAMQEEFLAQHLALQARIAACYPGAGLALPLSTQDILDAFSDIAREH